MALKYRIGVYSAISQKGLERFPAAHYIVGKAISAPDAIVLRSHNLEVSGCLQREGGRPRGHGVNNIPVAELSRRGVPVFNAPGANANAVKELVFAAIPSPRHATSFPRSPA
jgi:D-3-phosphoglycerate dehydrogenase